MRGHDEERRRLLRFARNRLSNLIGKNCHGEERSDVAISTFFMRLLRPRGARNDMGSEAMRIGF